MAALIGVGEEVADGKAERFLEWAPRIGIDRAASPERLAPVEAER